MARGRNDQIRDFTPVMGLGIFTSTARAALARVKTITALAIVASFPALVSGAANADDWFVNRLNQGMSGWWTCASTAAGITEVEAAFLTAARCTADQTLASLLAATVRLAEDQGREVFGRHFHIDNRLGLSVDGGGLHGEVDAVIPVQAFSSADHEADAGRALFMQSGVTRWTDNHGFRRNDLRHGLVQRFATFDGLDNGIFGLWVFYQQSLERGHERYVTGMDYAGRWGAGSLSYFAPTTDWLPGRPGYEERALEGMEVDLRFNATSTITLNAATGRWEAADGSGGWETRSRLGFDWRPHPWLRLGSNWADSGSGGDTVALRAELIIPLGGAEIERSRWQGFGTAGGTAQASPDVWRSVDTIGRIEVAERAVASVKRTSADAVTVRFLQDSVDTGGTVRVEVSLASPAAVDARFRIRLVPGSGDNPAVPGEDYVDETVEVTILAGETVTEASFRLLHNPSLESARSLSVAVDPIT